MNIDDFIRSIEIEGKDDTGFYSILYNTIIENNFTRVLEIGVCYGRSTRVILRALNQTKGHLWSIDIKKYPRTEELISKLGLASRWTFIYGDSRKVGQNWNKKIQMLFLDSKHTYPTTLKELELFAPWVSSMILLHDFKANSVSKATREYIRKAKIWKLTNLGTKNGLARLDRLK